jgi:tetratricopeptide (TPR) repeat protein
MAGAVALSLSRGGLLALLAAAALALALLLWKSRLPAWLGSAGLCAVLAALLVGWFGLDRVEARLATVWRGAALHEDRVPLWSRVLPLAKDYPVWGTGYGTFDSVEPLTRTGGGDSGWHYDHAHNDYLEALVEGGVPRLLLSLAAVGAALALGYRAFAHHAHDPLGGLALGGLFGLLTVAVHSFVDFGLHLPAIAILAAVLAAQLCALGDRPGQRASARAPRPVPAAAGPPSFVFGGLAPVLGTVALAAPALLLVMQGWREARMAQLCQEAARLATAPTGAARDERVALLEAAAALAPEYGRLQAEAAQARLDLLEEKTARLGEAGTLLDAAHALGSLAVVAPGGGAHPALAALPSWLMGAAVRHDALERQGRALERRHLAPGLSRLVLARDACPLLAEAQLQLALYRQQLGQADTRAAYLARARLLAPDDAETWYLSGLEDYFAGRPDSAGASWRRSLELSDRYLPAIVGWLGRGPRPREALEPVLPPRPGVWLAAASQLFPGPGADAARGPFLERARDLLRERGESRTAEDWHTLATLDRALGRPAEAVEACRRALDEDTGNVGWRCELAALLHDQGRPEEACRELRSVLAAEPDNGAARDLLERVTRDLAEKR